MPALRWLLPALARSKLFAPESNMFSVGIDVCFVPIPDVPPTPAPLTTTADRPLVGHQPMPNQNYVTTYDCEDYSVPWR